MDADPEPSDATPQPGNSFLVALTLLTVIPIHLSALPDDRTVARARLWFPAVGLLLGLLLGGLTFAAGFVPALIGAFVILIAWVGLTGALHIDGCCDLADGLFGGRTPEDRLRIMKDPHVGSFGLVAGVLLLLGKFVGLAALLTCERRDLAPWLIGLAVLTGRCLVLTVAAAARYPRPGGAGKLVVEATCVPEAALFALLALAAVLPLAFIVTPWLVAAALVPYLAVLALRRLCQTRLTGVTGDCLGAAVELTELLFLLTAGVILG